MFKNAGIEADMKTGLSEDEIVKIIPQYDALIVRSETKVTPKIIEAGKNLKIIGRAGVGVDNVDLPTATKNGVIVVNSPEGNTVAAAEHSFAMLLSMARQIPQAYSKLKSGVWDKKTFKGVEVLNKKLGVVGLGKIGRRVASYAIGMGMNVAVDVVEQIIEVLKGGSARSAVNIPSMKPETLAPVKPFMSIAEKLGALASQMISEPVSKVSISYAGEVAENNVSPLTTALLKGLLSPVMDVVINYVNAPHIAKERGIEIVESKGRDAKEFASLISVKVYGKTEQKDFAGTVSKNLGDRLVYIDGNRIDADPSGYLLILSNIDKPGMIGKVGTLLGSHNVNIASMDVGRKKVGEKAVMIINVDSKVSQDVLKELTTIEGISSASVVKL